MPSAFMPDVEVHIAFNAGYTTPAASRTWTDVSAYVELADRIQIAFGRQDERSTADANTLTLTLDNSDGRFTAGRSASPYYPNVKIGRPIRVRVTPPGGSASTRFVGFIDEWPVEWDGADRYARARIRATSRMSRLGLSTKLRNVVDNEIDAGRPLRHWALGDPDGSITAAESSGNGGAALVVSGGAGAAVVFGSGIGSPVDGITAAQFANGQHLIRTDALTASSGGLSFAIVTSTASQTVMRFSQVTGTDLPDVWSVTAAGKLQVDYNDGATLLLSTTTISDGSLHHVAVTDDGVNARLYVDGVLEQTNSPGIAPVDQVGYGFTGTLSHIVLLGGALTAGQIAGQSSAILNGFEGLRTDERVVRALGWGGVTSSEVTTQTGVETMPHRDPTGMSLLDVLREIESTEGGVLFDGRDGNVTFHNRSNRYLKTAAATLNMASQHVGADFAPKLDRSALVNDATVENPATGGTSRVVAAASRDEYGVATATATSVSENDEVLLQRASWLIASYSEPRTRVPSLTVDVVAHQGLTPSAQTLLGLNVSDLLAVTNAPTQADTTSQSYFIEGGTETIGPESYDITFNLSPTHPSLSTFVLDSATRGVLDTSILAY